VNNQAKAKKQMDNEKAVRKAIQKRVKSRRYTGKYKGRENTNQKTLLVKLRAHA